MPHDPSFDLILHLNGPFRATDGAGTEIAGLSRRAQALLAYVARQAGHRAERGLLADLLWSDRGEAQARASLRQELSVLRRILPSDVLQADRQMVRLAEGRVDLPAGDGEFLQGFDLASEGFEDWLRQERAATESTPAALAAPVRNRPGLAVMAFEELGASEDDMFSDGVVEEITGALSRVQEFHVIARQSAFALRDETLDVPAVSDRLGVDYVVEGSVRRAGERVRIAVQLVRGADGYMLWSERFDDHLDDLFDLQDRIAAQVAGQVSPNLRAAEILRAGTRPPQSRSAYDLTLTALPHFWAHRKEDNVRAIALLDAALDRDPGYGPALAYRAWALAQQPVYMWADDPAAAHREAARAVETAKPQIGDHAPMLVALGASVSLTLGDIPLSRAYIDRALHLDPNNAWGWLRSGWTSIYENRTEAALENFDRAEALSPLDPFRFNVLLGRSVCHRAQGDFDTSIALIHEGILANPGITWAYRMLAGDNLLAGREEAAQEAIAIFRSHYPHVTLSYLRNCWPPAIKLYQPAYYEGFKRSGLPEE